MAEATPRSRVCAHGASQALRLGNVDMGELIINHPASRVDPSIRLELVDALLAIELSPFTGEFDACDVKLALGEAGEVWPASVC